MVYGDFSLYRISQIFTVRSWEQLISLLGSVLCQSNQLTFWLWRLRKNEFDEKGLQRSWRHALA